MKAACFSFFAGVGGAIVGCTGAAHAAFTGLTMTATPGVIVQGALNGVPAEWVGQNVTTWRVYANFNNPLDALTGVYGNGTGPGFTALSITNDLTTVFDQAGSGFFNNTFGTDEAPSGALAAFEPSLLLDTYATIGAVAQPDSTQFSPGFPSGVLNGNGVQGQTNMSWFTSGPMPQGTGEHVLLGQWTVRAGEFVNGNVGIQYRPAGAAADIQSNNNSFVWPAPGALAVFGLAGAAGSRRRRA